ncbi:MAG: hypothetical protein ABI840_08080, partial [bacterium]
MAKAKPITSTKKHAVKRNDSKSSTIKKTISNDKGKAKVIDKNTISKVPKNIAQAEKRMTAVKTEI